MAGTGTIGAGDNGGRKEPHAEPTDAAVHRGVHQWRLIDDVAGRIDDAALRGARAGKDAGRPHELVYAAPGAG